MSNYEEHLQEKVMDVERFLKEQFGDVNGVLGLLAKHDLEMPTRPAVEKWFTRGSVTGYWLGTLQVALERETGAPIRMGRYIGDVSIFD